MQCLVDEHHIGVCAMFLQAKCLQVNLSGFVIHFIKAHTMCIKRGDETQGLVLVIMYWLKYRAKYSSADMCLFMQFNCTSCKLKWTMQMSPGTVVKHLCGHSFLFQTSPYANGLYKLDHLLKWPYVTCYYWNRLRPIIH